MLQVWQKNDADGQFCHWWQDLVGQRLSAMITIIVLVLIGFFLASLVVPLFTEGGVSDSIFSDGRGRLEASWNQSTLPDPRDLLR
jgi:hypothetical protein